MDMATITMTLRASTVTTISRGMTQAARSQPNCAPKHPRKATPDS
jgi:hypothetical protein